MHGKWKAVVMALAMSGAAAVSGAAELQPVESSWLDSAGYEPETGTLTIRMKNSSDVYEYQGVPVEVYQAFLDAESKGAYFATEIQDKYPTLRR